MADQLRQLGVHAPHLGRERPGPGQREHRHGLVGLDLAEALHDPAHPPLAGGVGGEDGEAHVPRGVDAEVRGDDGAVIQHAGDGEALGDEPVVQARPDIGGGGVGLDADQRGGEARARGLGQPVGREDVEHGAVEGTLGHAVGKERVGDELGMALPFQAVASELAEEVGGVRRGPVRAEAVEQRVEMGAVGCPVARGGIALGLDGEEGGAAGRGQGREGPGVQLVGQLVASGMVAQHGRQLGRVAGAASRGCGTAGIAHHVTAFRARWAGASHSRPSITAARWATAASVSASPR